MSPAQSVDKKKKQWRDFRFGKCGTGEEDHGREYKAVLMEIIDFSMARGVA